MEILDYERDIQIDPNALDVEWLEQPDLMRKYAKYAADVKRVMDETKERLDVTKAKLEMEIRTYPANFGLEKVTESAIQSTIILQESYQELSKEYIQAKYEYDVATAVLRALEQRKSALENLVKLLSVSYFAGPQTPRDLSQEQLQRRKQREQNTKVKIGQFGRKKREG